MKEKLRKYWTLFISTLYLSTFTFGGGYVIISLMRSKFVENLKWMSEDEMLNLTAIAQASPGAVAVNASILVGKNISGIIGAFVAMLGTVIPPFVILSIISNFYVAFSTNIIVKALLAGMNAGICAVILDVLFNLGKNVLKQKSVIMTITMVIGFSLVQFLKVDVMYIIIASGIIGAIVANLDKSKEEECLVETMIEDIEEIHEVDIDGDGDLISDDEVEEDNK